MNNIQVRIKTPFGEVVVEAENAQEILKILEAFPEGFMEKVGGFVQKRLMPSSVQLKGVIESTTEGPVIIARENLTHYEAIGLTLFASEGRKSTAAQITKLLESSGIKCMVPARLNEMTKRGQVFKPDPNRPEFKLTMQGERWVEDDVLSKLRSKIGQ
jgi:predicted transcriptional regulator